MKAYSPHKMKIKGYFQNNTLRIKINTKDTMDTMVFLITFESFVTFVLVLTHRFFKDSICPK